MTLINVPGFSGLNILAAPQRVRDDEATVAVGCDFRSLDLRPFKSDRDNGQATAADLSGGASLFQIDETRWLGVLGEKSFARSPAFNSGSSTAQRLFVADNTAPIGTEWDWVRDVDVAAITNSTLTGNEPRLGVPRPAPTTTLTYQPKTGRVTYFIRATEFDATIRVSNPESLKAGDSIILDVPGIPEGAFTISKKAANSPYDLTLRSTKLVYQQVAAQKTNNTKTLSFKKIGHGFSGGEQVILNKRPGVSSGFSSKLPTSLVINGAASGLGYNEMLFTVAWVSADEFKLTYGPDATELELTANSGETATEPMKIALVALSDDVIADAWDTAQVGVNVSAFSVYQQNVAYAGLLTDTDVVSTWEIANETLMERSYVVTFVNDYGDESEPSEPTKAIPVAQGDPVTFTTLPTTAASYAGDLAGVSVSQYRTPDKLRIYRTDATGQFRLLTTEVDDDRTITWTEAGTSGFEFVDTYDDSELGEPLSTQGWQIPPKDLNGLLVTPGGSLVGFKGRCVYGSVPYAPYAFPVSNQVAFDYEVVGLVATSAGLVVVTKGMPALIVGDDPASWSVQKLEYPYGCISRRSIVDMGEMAIYASADGLVGIVGASVEILTRDVMTRAQWNAFYVPSSNLDRDLQAAHAEGRYYGATFVGGVRKAFLFDPRTRSFVNMAVSQSVYPVAMSSRLSDDTLMLLKSNGHVYEWNRGTSDEPYLWRSKAFQLPRPDILGCAQLVAPALVSSKTITMRLIAWDGETVYTLAAFSNKTGGDFAAIGPAVDTAWEGGTARRFTFDKNINPFRLPVPNNRYTVYYVELEGDLPIAQVMVASVIDELKLV